MTKATANTTTRDITACGAETMLSTADTVAPTTNG
jgi:hypothetical protein